MNDANTLVAFASYTSVAQRKRNATMGYTSERYFPLGTPESEIEAVVLADLAYVTAKHKDVQPNKLLVKRGRRNPDGMVIVDLFGATIKQL